MYTNDLNTHSTDSTESDSNRPHILIIDDIVDNIQVAMNILQKNNYSFSFATNGAEGLELIKNTPDKFDLILLDIMMPKMDGYAVCKELKSDPYLKEVPIIFLTAKVDIESISKGFAYGAVDYITKPFHVEELLARVQNHLDLYIAKKLLKQNNISLIKNQKHLLSELEESQREIIYILTELMEVSSDETGKHIKRMAEASALFAKYLPSLTDEDRDTLLSASPMHDIGKLMVPHEILHKRGSLDDNEFKIMQRHTLNAYELLKKSPRKLLKAAAIIAHEHHEKWDGTGYPRQLVGEEIHIYGRVVAIADVFDALTHERCYKKAWPPEDALAYIKELSGKHFDPELVAILETHFDEFKAINNKF